MNILILMGDQHRFDALGCAATGVAPEERTWLMGPAGEPLVRTPHLDRLAAGGVRFAQAVANLPVCVPCRHSFITGLYPHQIGILTNSHYWPDQPPVPTLGHRLGAAGYATAAVGKMHWKGRTAPEGHVPDKRGFAFRAGRGRSTEGPLDVRPAGDLALREGRRQEESTARFGTGGESRAGYVGDVALETGDDLPEAWLAGQAVDFLRRHHAADPQRPFCLLVSLDRPHPPCVVPADYAGRYDPGRVPLPPAPPPGFVEDDPHVRTQIARRGWGEMDEGERRLAVARYLANVTYVDACLGRVLEALADLGYEEDTLVVLLSDHGELLGERGGAYTKYSLYDAALRVPLLVRWPGVSRPGLVSHAPVELVDLMPTWLAAAGLEVPPLLPGRSLRPLLEGQDPSGAPAGGAAAGWRTATLSEQYTSTSIPGAPRGQWALRERRYKLIERATGRSALYDLAEDPLEHHNRIDDPALADVRDRLRTQLLRDVIARAEQFPARWEPAVAIAPPAPAAP